jgi:uncharacterized membrane protein YdfJ with MMPL/SSD domain
LVDALQAALKPDHECWLIARYREELRRHEDRHEAMAVALHRAGPAILASGATVIAGMLCLLVADSADISGLGPVAAIGIAVGLVAMVTLLLVVMIILGLLLRAVVAPLVLIGTVVLSFGAALGLSALAFRHLFGFAGEDTSVPLFIFVFLVALGIDYNIFLMTRVREESIRSGTRRGAITGLAATGGVITSAGAVLAGTFAMLGTLPLVIFTEIGWPSAPPGRPEPMRCR